MATKFPTLEELLPAVEEDLRQIQFLLKFRELEKTFFNSFSSFKAEVLPNGEVSRIVNEATSSFEKIFDLIRDRTNND